MGIDVKSTMSNNSRVSSSTTISITSAAGATSTSTQSRWWLAAQTRDSTYCPAPSSPKTSRGKRILLCEPNINSSTMPQAAQQGIRPEGSRGSARHNVGEIVSTAGVPPVDETFEVAPVTLDALTKVPEQLIRVFSLATEAAAHRVKTDNKDTEKSDVDKNGFNGSYEVGSLLGAEKEGNEEHHRCPVCTKAISGSNEVTDTDIGTQSGLMQ